jgi:2,5-diamino-6-(ribosylamino)-4(3H)-pyrimidinone 5'-phosphate reductase
VHVHVNAAVSADGKLSTREREQVTISGGADFARVDRIRAEADAVMVGVGTVLSDDPSLRRHDELHRADVHGEDAGPPARAVADSRARTPPDADVLAGDQTTYLLVTESAPDERVAALEDAGTDVVSAGAERVDLPSALGALADRGVEYLMVEGGGELIYSLFATRLVDRLTVFVGSVVIGGRDAPTLVDGEGFVAGFPSLDLRDVERVDEGVVLDWVVK